MLLVLSPGSRQVTVCFCAADFSPAVAIMQPSDALPEWLLGRSAARPIREPSADAPRTFKRARRSQENGSGADPSRSQPSAVGPGLVCSKTAVQTPVTRKPLSQLHLDFGQVRPCQLTLPASLT